MSADSMQAGARLRAGAPAKARKPTWQIRLGAMEWRRYTYERKPDDVLQLLGSVRKGLQVGALARTLDGRYLLLVGDHETPLNQAQIEKAIGKLPKDSRIFPTYTPPKPGNNSTVVVVKKRRLISPN